MEYASREVLEELKEFDTATLFNAVIESMGASQGGTELEGKGGMPQNYTNPEIRCLLPELGRAVGYAITAEVTTNDPDSEAIPWDEYYDLMEQTPVAMVAVMKDVDSRSGRGASFGDGMATRHKAYGVTGAIVDGSVRDLMGIKDVGLPMWGRGLVPGHGVFSLIRVNTSVTVARASHPPKRVAHRRYGRLRQGSRRPRSRGGPRKGQRDPRDRKRDTGIHEEAGLDSGQTQGVPRQPLNILRLWRGVPMPHRDTPPTSSRNGSPTVCLPYPVPLPHRVPLVLTFTLYSLRSTISADECDKLTPHISPRKEH